MLLAMISVLTLLPKLILIYEPFVIEIKPNLMIDVLKYFLVDINLSALFFLTVHVTISFSVL